MSGFGHEMVAEEGGVGKVEGPYESTRAPAVCGPGLANQANPVDTKSRIELVFKRIHGGPKCNA
jgi:hypothetical protein